MRSKTEISIKSRAVFRSLAAAGLAISISLPALAEETGLGKPSPAAALGSDISDKPAGTSAAIPDKWQGMSAEERTARRKAMREHWKNMPPEEREALRKKMKERWKKMSPEERAARRTVMRERWEKMSPEERDQFKRDMGKQGNK